MMHTLTMGELTWSAPIWHWSG